MKLSVSQTSQKFFVGMAAGLTVLTLGLSAWAQDPTVFRTKNSPIPVSGENLYWTNAASWTWLSGGPDGDGIPDADDTVQLYTIAWPAGYSITIDQPWACSNLFVKSDDGNDHNLNINAEGSISSVTWSNSRPGFGWRLNNNANLKRLTYTEWHDVGPLRARYLTAMQTMLEWAGPVKITYHTAAENQFDVQVSFTNASSVYLAPSPYYATATNELIATWGLQHGNDMPAIALGRADNADQNWTVASGAHPRLRARITNYGRCIGKIGLGDVNMADVDLELDIINNSPWGGQNNGSISKNGLQPGASLYDGTIRANSYWIDATNSTAYTHYCFIAGKLYLDGQGGQEGGAAGNGRAVTVASSGSTNLHVRLTTDAPANFWHSTINPANKPLLGRVEIAPGGGEFTLTNTPGPGKLGLNIMAYATDVSNAVLIANTINLASTNSYISERDEFRTLVGDGGRPEYSNGCATIEMRGNLVNRSIMSTSFHVEKSILRFIGGLTNDYATLEAAGKDYGLDGVGFTNNFAIGTLVLGKTSTGTVSMARVVLTDTYVNYPGATPPEAVYVNTLEMYGNSQLVLNGINLYYRNGGSWTKAQKGPFANGDGTGRILNSWPVLTSGTILMVR